MTPRWFVKDLGSSFTSLAVGVDDGQGGTGTPGGDDRAIAVAAVSPGILASDGSRAIVTAQSMNLAGGFDMMTLKYTSNAAGIHALSHIYYPLGLSSAADLPSAVSAPSTFDWFITGRSFNPTTLDNCVTVHYFDPSP